MPKTFIIIAILYWSISLLSAQSEPEEQERVDLALVKEISGNINPQDIVFAPQGAFFVPNSATHHSISVFDRTYFKVDDIDDGLFLSDYFFHEYKGEFKGAPYRGAASPDGKHIWVANFSMEGKGFKHPGFENCISPGDYDPSFVYKINTETYQVETVIKVGSTPSHIAISPNGRYLVVSARCGGDVSIIDTDIQIEKFRLQLGEYPSGVCINSTSTRAYVALTGEDILLEIDLHRGHISRFIFKGRTPYDVKLGPSDRYLYVSYLKEGKIGKIDLKERRIVDKIEVGKWPKDLLLSPNGRYLYVLEEKNPAITKIRTDDMTLIQRLELPSAPRGMDLDPIGSQLWIAMEEGIGVYEDISMDGVQIYTPNPFASREDSSSMRDFRQNYQTKKSLDIPASKHASTKVYHIIVGSYHTLEKAEERKSALHSIGFENCNIIPASSGFYRLSVRQYKDLTQASTDLPRFKEKFGPDTWILDPGEESP